tara:strand:+ start:196 stop:1197 length:1002 start_codon:yes stop_codon:yes gene_type:complete
VNEIKNISTLDLFRGVAGYGVAISHYFFYLYKINIFQFYSIFFVEFFFVLSGFVLYPQLKKVYLDNKNLKIFYARRWLRTIPPYFIALACYSLLFNKFDSDTVKYLFFVQKITDNFVQDDYFSVAWSLSVEELFYLFFPIFLLILNKKRFLNIILFFLVIVYFYKIAHLYFNVDQEFYRIGTFLRLDAIAFGVLLRIYFNKVNNNFLNIITGLIILFLMNYFLNNLTTLNGLDLFLFIFLVQFFSINMIILFINFEKYIINKRIKDFFSLLSKQTYSIYLFHLFFVHFIGSMTFINNHFFSFILYLASLFLFSTLFYLLIEKIIIKNRPSYIN